MMDAYAASILVQAFACNARVAGMAAENQHRIDCGNGVAYGEESFQEEANILEHLAGCLRAHGC